MSSVGRKLETAHGLVARASGDLALMLSKKRLGKLALNRCNDNLKQAGKIIEELLNA